MAAIDAVVFDVDGVLIDTEASYTEAVVRTVRHLAPDAPVDRELVRLWRRSGDWNNDWDLSFGLYCWVRGSPELPAAEAARRSLAELESAARGRLDLDYAAVQGIFEELYNGTAVAVRRYGVTPRVFNERPLADDERIVIRPRLLDELHALGIDKVGIVTGRVRADWAQVAARLPFAPDVVVATDEDGRKPDPAALRIVAGALGAERFAMVGDTLNDLRMVQAYNAAGHGRGYAVLLCRPDEERAYRDAGADATILALDDLPGAIRRLAS
ncbi:MAG TPA: HAD-IA family hydrolase [Candidatus Limnocylindria bacterium]